MPTETKRVSLNYTPEFLNDLRNRDHAAFTKLYEDTVKRVRANIGMILPGEDIEEFTQAAFAKAWSIIDSYQPQPGKSPLNWLMPIARNNAIDLVRVKNNRKKIRGRTVVSLDKPVSNGDNSGLFEDYTLEVEDPEDPYEEVERKLDEHPMVQKLNEVLGLLTENRRQLIKLSFFEGLTDQEIAHTLKKTVRAVQVLKHRSLEDLKEMLSGDENGNMRKPRTRAYPDRTKAPRHLTS